MYGLVNKAIEDMVCSNHGEKIWQEIKPKADLDLETDDPIHDLLERFFEKKGFEIKTALSGLEGINLAKSLRPEAITLDISLPIMDGWSATKNLKTDPATKSMPIIALTAHTMAGDREKA